ncbi:hypothetical protein HYPSUDRAFT_91732 [Hypholoma sublateritium FD-334 SS-4]|uniref:F-box domain-containing protein n=1 Tax=Hypholoma sublateritium (strain FD-334 SS-4) TaxID=945553 RepID=A0A0D2NGI1_HYPSF|nr:hypothetical protein HYPSUDRAFT_91732 [Hypholoma sublateritium FD-334 SS-4]
MLCSEPPRLPTELIELIIDEVPDLPHASSYSRILTFSAIACVSHLFRQCANKHRFTSVAFQRQPLVTRARLFLDLLQSNIWTDHDGISYHIKNLSLGVAVRRGEGNGLTLHPALVDGTMSSIIREVFRENPTRRTVGNQLILSTHIHQRLSAINANELHGFDWTLLPSEFVGVVQNLCHGSNLTSLHLQWFTNIPNNWLSSSAIKRLRLDQAHFSAEQLVHASAPFPALEILEMCNSCSFIESMSQANNDFDDMKMLDYTIESPRDAYAFTKVVRKAPRLETLRLHIGCKSASAIPVGFINRNTLPTLTSLTMTFSFYHTPYRREQRPISEHAIDILKGDFPPLNHLHIVFENDRTYTPQTASNSVTHCLQLLDPSAMGTLVAMSAPNPLTNLTVQLNVLLRMAQADEFAPGIFEEEGATRLHQFFSVTEALQRTRFQTLVAVKEY